MLPVRERWMLSAKWTVGEMNCRWNELSVKWTVGEVNCRWNDCRRNDCRRNDCRWNDCQRNNCRWNELSAKWTVGEIIVGEMRCRWNDCRWNAADPRTRHITKQKNHKSIGHCLHKTQHKTVYSINIKTYYPGKIINLAYANQLVS